METNPPSRVPLYLGGAVLAVVLVLGGAWFVAPFLAGEPEPPTVVRPQQAPKATGRTAKAGRPAMGGGPVVYQGDEGGGGGASAPRGKAAGAKAGARGGQREERTAAFNTHLDDYARQKGWDQGTTDEVRTVILSTVQDARTALAEARQAKDRDLARQSLQTVREKQEAALNDILGPEESKAFVTGMEFGQYFPRVAERSGKAGGGGRGGRQQ
jgi:hypothetical protein